MKNKIKSRRIYAISKYLLFTSMALVALFTASQVFAAENTGDKWTLVEPVKINPNNEQTSFAGGGALDWWYSEERYLGKTLDYTVSETSITMADHEFDRGEYWNVKFTASFTKPPSSMTEGQTIALPVSLSGGGSVTSGGGAQSGIRFEYRLNGNTIKDSQLGIFLDFKSASANPSFVVPKPTEGGKLVITAFLWNCAACVVEWEYKAEIAEEEVVAEPTPVAELVTEEAEKEEPAPAETPADEEKVVEETNDNPCLGVMTQDEIDKIGSQPGGVTIIEHIRGDVKVFREGKWTQAQPYMILQPGEAVQTGPGSEAFFIIKKVLHEGDEAYVPLTIQQREASEQFVRNSKTEGLEWLWGAMKAQTVWGQVNFTKYEAERAFLDENSELCTGDYHQTYESERGFIDLIKGGIHMITKGWKSGSIFSVKAGTTVCGIRGSEIFVSYHPDTKQVGAYVIEGHMDVTNSQTNEMKSLTNNQKLAVDNGALSEVQTMSEEEWSDIAVVVLSESEADPSTDSTSSQQAGSGQGEEKKEETEKNEMPVSEKASEDASEEKGFNPIFFILMIAIFVIFGPLAYKKIKK